MAPRLISRGRLELLRSNARIYGLWDTLWHGAASFLSPRGDDFDARHGTETEAVQYVRFDERPAPGQKSRSIPSSRRLLQHVLKTIPLDHRDYTFIDLGCGKGRAILIASEFPFAKISGVEWSHDLAETARLNLASYRSKTQKCTNIEIHCMNVVDFAFPDSDSVLYLFNPFGQKILKRVFENISASLEESPRRLGIVFTGLLAPDRLFVLDLLDQHGFEVVHEEDAIQRVDAWLFAIRPVGGKAAARR